MTTNTKANPTNVLKDIAKNGKKATQQTVQKAVAPLPEKNSQNNEVAALQNHFRALVQSLELIAEEQESMKGIFGDLKKNHGIDSKVARKVARILFEGPKKGEALTEEYEAVQEMLKTLS